MFLKQSTPYTFRFGPFLDDTDGKTAETGLTISQADIRLSKGGQNFAQKNESSTSTHDEIGFYIVVLNATDTNTCGELLVACHESGALPVFKTFQVLEEAIYDALFAASANAFNSDGRVDVASIEGSDATDQINAACDAAFATYDGPTKAEMDSAFATTNGKIDTVDGIVDDILLDTAVIGAAGAGLTAVPWNSAWDAEVQSECAEALTAYDPPTKAELDSGLAGLNDPTAGSIADAVWDEATSGHTSSGSYGKAVGDGVTAWVTATGFNTTTPPTVGAISDAVWDEATSGHTSSGSYGKALSDILTDTAEIGSAGAGLTAVPWNSSWDAEVQSECNDALVALGLDHLVSASVAGSDVVDDSIIAKLVSKESTADWDDFVNTTDSLQALRDQGDSSWITASPPAVSAIADAVWNEAAGDHTSSGSFGKSVADILTDTAEIGSAGAGLTAIPWNSAWDTEVQSECADALTAYDAPTKAEMDTAHSTTDALITTVDTVVDQILLDTAEIGAAGAGLTAVPWNSSWDAEVQSECNDALVAIGLDHLVSASVAGSDVVDNSIIAKLVSKESTADWDDYVNTTESLQALRDRGDSAWTTGGGGSAPTVAEIRAEMDSNSTKLADIVADTAVIGANGAGLSAIPWNSAWDSEVESEVTDALNAYDPPTKTEMDSAFSTTDGKIDAVDDFVDTEVAAIKTVVDRVEADTQDIQNRIPASLVSGKMDASVSDVVSAGLNDMWATAVTESYASDGADATPAQLLYMIYCCVGEFSVSGTTITGKKLNGSDTAMTWTTNDGTNPTSRTRSG